MRRLTPTLAGIAAMLVLCAPAKAEFGLLDTKVAITEADGSHAGQAGSHPFALTTSFGLAYTGEGTEAIADGKVRDVIFDQAAGLVADATAVPHCTTAEFVLDTGFGNVCPAETVVGIQSPSFGRVDFFETPAPVFQLPPPPGVVLRLAWKVRQVPLILDLGVNRTAPYNGFAATRGINQTLPVFGSVVELWGVPADPAHDLVRGGCASAAEVVEASRFQRPESGGSCPANAVPVPLLTLPRSCPAQITTRYRARSWQEPGRWVTGSHSGPGVGGCGRLRFLPAIDARPTSRAAQSPTGLDFSLLVADEGLKNPNGRAASDIRKVVTTLPEGMSANPSLAEGLEVCSESDLERETLHAAPGHGCPEASKIGTVEVESPLVSETVKGSLFIAEPYENPFDSLLALYIVLKHPRLGILVKQPLEVRPDSRTGRLVTIADDIPQLPFSNFRLRFREGARSPLVSPPRCGTHEVKAVLTPWSGEAPVLSVSSFKTVSGPQEGPCPRGGVPPFEPGFEAGSLNNAAGAFSPFNMRLTRRDGEQDMTKFSAVLPPGVLGSLAGVAKCPEAAIAVAKEKTGLQELASPSCPPASSIGRTVAGAGVGSQLTYVPGSLYLAGPHRGAPLSVVSITPAVAGPFDAGTVVVREALTLNPRTAKVEVDGSASDPIPHILQGIPLNVRDLRVHVDRQRFILNPTSCEESSAQATLFGSFLDVLSEHDDRPVGLFTRYQAAGCASLGFKPRLKMWLKGGTRRGAHPGLRAVYRPRPGDANAERVVVTLPTSAFLDQSHIRTICTRVQFAAGVCPKAAQYGFARAWTPLLDEPLQGPIYLRSSNNKLPDFVAHLKGIVDIEVAARIDSKNGGIRTTFSSVPDAPVSRFAVRLQGGKKGVIVNSRNLCRGKNRASVRLKGHNDKRHVLRPVLHNKRCKKRRKAKRSAHRSKAGAKAKVRQLKAVR